MTKYETIIHYHKLDKDVLRRLKNKILSRVSEQALIRRFPILVRDSIDFCLDHDVTGRSEFSQLDKVERTYIGLKIEHRLRYLFKAERGDHDLLMDRTECDCKNTIGKSWAIGEELYRHNVPCILTQIDPEKHLCRMGLMVARREYLGAPNKDGKCNVLKNAYGNIRWLLDNIPFPQFDSERRITKYAA